MKKILFFTALIALLYSCKDSEEKTNTETEVAPIETIADKKVIMYSGDFVYTADAAVIKGANFIYGVKLDSMASELANRVRPIKETDFDMVHVIVIGDVSPKPEGQEGWDEILTIKEIVSVGNKPAKIDLKLEDSKN